MQCRLIERKGKNCLPLSVHVNHGLVDGFHVGQFIKLFSTSLNK
jgi:chloramphenicol O-acetyltransferase type A